MASVKIFTGLYGGEDAATVPRHQWRELVRTRRTICNSSLRQDCRALVFFIEDAARNDWLEFGGRDEYIRDGLGLEPEMVDWAVDGLRKLDGAQAVTLDAAVVLGRHGGARKGDAGEQGSNATLELGRGADYQLARLRRDRPDLAERVVRGEMSANAAAIAAGFREKQVQLGKDPEKAAQAIITVRGLNYARQLAAAIAAWEG